MLCLFASIYIQSNISNVLCDIFNNNNNNNNNNNT